MRFLGRLRPKASKKLGLALIFIVLVALAGLFIKIMSSPAEGVINNNVLPPSEVQPETILTARGKYISFNYPSSFTKTPSEKPSGNELETLAFTKKPFPFWFLNVTVSSLPSGNLADDGSYNMRSLDKEHYKKVQTEISGTLVSTFSDDSQPYSKTAFITHGGKVFSLSLRSDDLANKDKLDSVFNEVLNSLKWLN